MTQAQPADQHQQGDQPLDVVVWATGYRPDYGWIKVPGVVRIGSRHQ